MPNIWGILGRSKAGNPDRGPLNPKNGSRRPSLLGFLFSFGEFCPNREQLGSKFRHLGRHGLLNAMYSQAMLDESLIGAQDMDLVL